HWSLPSRTFPSFAWNQTKPSAFALLGKSPMPSARYYREQAQLLLFWALAAKDLDHATQLTAQAIEQLTRSLQADGARRDDLDQVIMCFNEDQITSRRALQQQQQQPQAKSYSDPE